MLQAIMPQPMQIATARHVTVARIEARLCAHLKDVKLDKNQQLAAVDSAPIYTLGGAVSCRSQRAPVGAIVKVATMSCPTLSGPVRQAITCRRAFGDRAQAYASYRMRSSEAAPSLWDSGPQTRAPTNLDPTNLERERRPKAAPALDILHITGAVRKYPDQPEPAIDGAIVQVGGKADRVCHANI